jgi:Transcriptional Coactivator p15 (PC4)
MHAIVDHLTQSAHKQIKKCQARKGFAMATTPRDDAESNSRITDLGGSVGDALIVAEWPVNEREVARVSIEKFKDARLINCRKWFRTENGELRPSKRGIALGVGHLPKLVEAFTGALSIARDRGLLGGQP